MHIIMADTTITTLHGNNVPINKPMPNNKAPLQPFLWCRRIYSHRLTALY